MFKNLLKVLFLFSFMVILVHDRGYAQTKGFIYQSGSDVLDPDTIGYVSDSTSGFSNDGYDVDEFEIPMFPMVVLGSKYH